MRFSIAILLFAHSAYAQTPKLVGAPDTLFFCLYCDMDNMALSAQATFAAKGSSARFIGNAIQPYDQRDAKVPFPKFVSQYKEGGGAPETTKSFIRARLVEQMKAMDHSKPVTIFISDHGWNGAFSGSNMGPPEKAGFACKAVTSMFDGPSDVVITYGEFADMLKEAGLTGAGAPAVRVIGDHCYGGAVHYLSEKFPNMCTAAYVKHTEPVGTAFKVGAMFWDEVKKKKDLTGTNASLQDAYYASYNRGGGEYTAYPTVGAALSSMEYVKKLLEKHKSEVPDYDRTLIEDNLVTLENVNPKDASSVCTTKFESLPENLIQQTKKIVDVVAPSDNPNHPWRLAVEDLRKNQGYYQSCENAYQAAFKKAQTAWRNLTNEEKILVNKSAWDAGWTEGIGSWFTDSYETGKKLKLTKLGADKQKAFQDFVDAKKKYLPSIEKYYREKLQAERIRDLSTFAALKENGKLTKDEIKTFQRMVECENLPL